MTLLILLAALLIVAIFYFGYFLGRRHGLIEGFESTEKAIEDLRK